MKNHVVEQINGEWKLRRFDRHVITCVLFPSKRIVLRTDRVEITTNIKRSRPTLGSLEHQMLNKMRRAVDGWVLVTRANFDEYQNRHGLRAGVWKQVDTEAVIQDERIFHTRRSAK